MAEERDGKQVIQKIVDNMSLMDDDLMSKVFSRNLRAPQLVLRTILGREDIEVISAEGQREFNSPIVGGRRIRLDIVTEDEQSVTSNIEVQRKNSGAHPRRARFHSSMMDSRMLEASQKFKDLKDSYTIFITEKDYFRKGLPLYTIERQIKEGGGDFGDGSHIIYVNGSYDGDDALGRLIKDFKCKNPKDMYYSELAEGVRYFKEEGGREEMCEAVEKYARGYAKRYAADVIAEKKQAIAEKIELEKEVEKLRQKLALYEAV